MGTNIGFEWNQRVREDGFSGVKGGTRRLIKWYHGVREDEFFK